MPRPATWCCGCASGPAWISTALVPARFCCEVASGRGAGRGGVQAAGHSSITTTVSVYGHLTAEDARNALEAAGWFTGTGVTL